jgi:sulfotransferase family protein
MGEITPLFIFGMGRSGTTNALRVVNSHPEVMLNGEIPNGVMRRLFQLLDTADESFVDRRNIRGGWLGRKEQYIYEAFSMLNKAGPRKPELYAAARFRGHKSPRQESMFDDYERHFASVGRQPLYFYCARNPKDCYRSYRAMDWNAYKSVGQFLGHYMESFRKLEEMQAKTPGRVFVLVLDELIASGDPLAFYRERMFAPLGLTPSAAFARTVETLDARREEGPRPEPLSRADSETIDDYPGIAELYKTVFGRFARVS